MTAAVNAKTKAGCGGAGHNHSHGRGDHDHAPERSTKVLDSRQHPDTSTPNADISEGTVYTCPIYRG